MSYKFFEKKEKSQKEREKLEKKAPKREINKKRSTGIQWEFQVIYLPPEEEA